MLSQSRLSAARKATWPTPSTNPNSFHSAIKLIGVAMSYDRNAEIYAENDPAENLYKVISGTVRSYKILDDGRRQIGAFYFPGDIFGLEIGSEHTFSTEAIVDSEILLIKRSSLIALAARDNNVARQLWTLTATELRRVQGHATVLIMSAQERVIGFLLEMAKRSAAASEIDLPMSRGDIADYLGLTIETVSRTFKQLEKSASIALPTSRHIVLRNCTLPN